MSDGPSTPEQVVSSLSKTSELPFHKTSASVDGEMRNNAITGRPSSFIQNKSGGEGANPTELEATRNALLEIANLPEDKPESELEKLKLSLRTSQEAQSASENGEAASYTLQRNGQSIAVEGGKHEWNDAVYLNTLVSKTLNRDGKRAGMVFVELNPDLLAQIKALPKDTPPLEIAKKYSEQGYIAWQAMQQGIQVRAWDLSPEAQIQQAAKAKEPKAVLEWMIGQSMDSLRRNYGDQIPAEILAGFKDRMTQLLQQTGIDLNTLSKLTVAGVEVDLNNPSTLLQISRDQAELVSSPRTNEVSAYISQARNENAM